jgi:hypothetical protein
MESWGEFDLPNGKSLDCLVLRSASRAVGASDRLYVTTSLLITSVGRALLDHDCRFYDLLVSKILSADISDCRNVLNWYVKSAVACLVDVEIRGSEISKSKRQGKCAQKP